MINLTYAEIDFILGSGTDQRQQHAHVIYYDTRRISSGDNSIFVAVRSPANDGNVFAQAAYDKGVRNFILGSNTELNLPADAHVWYADDTLLAMHQLAKASRAKYKGLVIGITGSNGKTIVKEWLYQLLADSQNIWRSPRSYNSQLGVALSLLQMDLASNMAVIETGISTHGEMAKLQAMVKPQMVIFTHVGDAHSDGFASTEQKIAEKAMLAADVDVAVLGAGVKKEYLEKYMAANGLMKVINWNYEPKASYVLKQIEKHADGSKLIVEHKTQTFDFWIPLTDNASIHNAMTCLCALAALEQLGTETLQNFKKLKPIENRLQISAGLRNNEIINDSYSNDLSAFEIALDYLETHADGKNKVLIFSDFDIQPELNYVNIALIANWISKHKINMVLAIGNWLHSHAAKLPAQVQNFETTQDLIESKLLDTIENSTILIKGARKYGLERVSNLLEHKLHATRLEVNLQAVRNNIKHYKSLLPKGTKLMGMIKAMAYGAGDYELAKTLQTEGADYLGVAFAAEGAELRKKEINLPLLVLNTQADEMWTYRHFNLEPAVYSFKNLEAYKLQFGDMPLNIHIELDSGMHRLGFEAKDAEEIAAKLPANFTVVGVFSHLAVAESEQFDTFTQNQFNAFNDFAQRLENSLNYNCIKHIANTAGIVRHSAKVADMVRLGIGLYGVKVANEKTDTAIALYTSISQIKTIKPNNGIGYGQRNAINTERRLAILPIGYADGLMRIASTQGKPWYVAVNQCMAPIVGTICMDMCMIDVTDIDCNEGDEVEIFGNQISVESLAQHCGTIPYEILSRIAPRVKRVYIQE